MMFPAIVYAKIKKVPLTTYVLDLWPDNLYTTLEVKNKFMRGIAKSVSHWFYKRCDKLISLSQSMLEKVREISPKSQHAVIFQHCEDLYFEKPTSDEIKKQFEGKFNVLFAGNISPAQNLGMLLECAKILKQHNNTSVHFIIVGDGMSRIQLQKEIETADACEYFTFTGQKPVEEMPSYFAAAQALFVAYSNEESLNIAIPAKLASYFAAGKPCLVSLGGEGASATKNSGAGLASDSGDVIALYNNIVKMQKMTDNELEEMGANARAFCEENFKRDLILKKLEKFILCE